MNRLDGKVALISGAARGIGAEAARLMAEAGPRSGSAMFWTNRAGRLPPRSAACCPAAVMRPRKRKP